MYLVSTMLVSDTLSDTRVDLVGQITNVKGLGSWPKNWIGICY